MSRDQLFTLTARLLLDKWAGPRIGSTSFPIGRVAILVVDHPRTFHRPGARKTRRLTQPKVLHATASTVYQTQIKTPRPTGVTSFDRRRFRAALSSGCASAGLGRVGDSSADTRPRTRIGDANTCPTLDSMPPSLPLAIVLLRLRAPLRETPSHRAWPLTRDCPQNPPVALPADDDVRPVAAARRGL